MRRYLRLNTALAGLVALGCLAASAAVRAEDAAPAPPVVAAPVPDTAAPPAAPPAPPAPIVAAPVPTPEAAAQPPASPQPAPPSPGAPPTVAPVQAAPTPPQPTAAELLRDAAALQERRQYAEALVLLRQAADAGDSEAMARVADAYGTGRGVTKDEAAALSWYRKAAELGHANAMNHVGYAIDHGIGISPPDQAEALKWYRKAAELGDAGGLNNLGYAFSNGRGVAQDMTEALRLYRKAADLGSSFAMFNLGDAYDTGRGVTRDQTVALSWYRKSADLGNGLAMNYVGQAYENSKGVPQDFPQSVIWYRKGADAGNALAMSNLGYALAHGRGVKRDDAQALAWYRKAADLGDNAAAVGAGDAYAKGLGVDPDEVVAMRYYRIAADRGDRVGMYNLGVMYRDGRGGPADAAQAMRWFRRASEAGYAPATKAIYDQQVAGTRDAPPLTTPAVPAPAPRRPGLGAPAAPAAPAGSVAADDEGALQLSRPTRQQVQQGLAALGLDPGDLREGAFTPRTRQAITAYQRKLGLNPTGYLTADLLQRLLVDAKARRVEELNTRAGRLGMPGAQRLYAEEQVDFGIAAQDVLQDNVAGPTPTTLPGGIVLTTQDLIRRLNDSAQPRHVIVDVLDGGPHRSITGALRMPLAGKGGSFDDAIQRAMVAQLRNVLGGRLDANLVFLCAGARCWESYNAALRAIHAGYRNVFWYRGGLAAWQAAGQPTGAAAGSQETAL